AIRNSAPNLSNAFDFLPVGPRVFFHAIDGPDNEFRVERLWTTDGTAAGTAPLGPASLGASELTDIGGMVFWVRGSREPEGGAFRQDIWRSDGTVAGTRRAATFPSARPEPSGFFQLDGTVYFRA